MMRAVLYARYSSDLQSDASIEDQLEVCRRYTAAQGWTVVETFTDAAISGASRFRPAFQRLLAAAGNKTFDVVVCEAVDRLGRRLADTADLRTSWPSTACGCSRRPWGRSRRSISPSWE